MVAWYPAKVEAAFGAAPVADPATIPSSLWRDITSYVKGWTTERGRSYEYDEFQAGTASLVLHNDDKRFTPGYNPASGNLLDADRATGGSTCGGVQPSDIAFVQNVATLTNQTMTMGPVTGFSSPYGYIVTVTAGATGKGVIATVHSQAEFDGTRDVATMVRVDGSTAYNFGFKHRLASGAIGTTIQAQVDWLDSNGAYISTNSSLTATPTGTATRLNANATSPANARYAMPHLEYNGVPTAHVLHTSDWQFAVGTSVAFPDYLYWPNIRPRVPVRITLQDSTATYQPMFYGVTEDWQQAVDGLEVTLDLVDATDYLAGITVDTGRDAQVAVLNPTVSVPLSDESNTRRSQFQVNFGTVGSETQRVRAIRGTANAADLSEYAWGEDGPQPGQRALRLDPESANVGYGIRMDLPAADMLNESGYFSHWGWFKVKRKEHGARVHVVSALRNTGYSYVLTAYVGTDGTLNAGINNASGSPYATLTTTNTYHDGEWHFFCVRHWNNGGTATATLYVDYDGTNGEAVSANVTASRTWTLGATPAWSIGGFTDQLVSTGADCNLLRGWVAGIGWVADTELTSSQVINLYRAGAPPATFPGEGEATRIQRCLDWLSWPAAMTSLDASVTTLSAASVANVNLLSEMQRAAGAAGGAVFIDKSGVFRFVNRRARYNPTTALTCTEAGGTMPENDVTASMDLKNTYTQVVVQRETGNNYTKDDTAAQDKYGVRTLTLDMPILDDADAEQAGWWHLYLYSEPAPRVSTLTFLASAASGNTLWDFLVNLELMDGSVVYLPTLDSSSNKFFVERVSLEYDQGSLTFRGTLELSPADKYTNVFTLDSSALDGAVLGW